MNSEMAAKPPAYTPRHSDAEYLGFDPFAGDHLHVEFRRIRIVKTRSVQDCSGSTYLGDFHQIPAGQRAWCEAGKIEGFMGRWYTCLECLDKLMDKER